MFSKNKITKLSATFMLTLFVAAVFCGVSQVQAVSTVLEDDFENGLSNWTANNSPTIVTTPVANGSHAV